MNKKKDIQEYELVLMQKALKKHGKIFPCADKKSFLDCFTNDNGKMLFWYNTEDKSTHIVTDDN